MTDLDALVAKLRGATRGLCTEDASGYVPRGVSAQDCVEAASAIERLKQALEPFSDFANLSGAGYLPDEHVITLGSGMAARQLTMGDCRTARAALSSEKAGSQ